MFGTIFYPSHDVLADLSVETPQKSLTAVMKMNAYRAEYCQQNLTDAILSLSKWHVWVHSGSRLELSFEI